MLLATSAAPPVLMGFRDLAPTCPLVAPDCVQSQGEAVAAWTQAHHEEVLHWSLL